MVLTWLRLNIGCSQIQGHYIFIMFPVFYRFFTLLKYKNSLANWQKLPSIFVSFQHPTKVVRSMVYNITVSSVSSNLKLYEFKILNILIGLITMFIINNTHSCYLFIIHLYLLFHVLILLHPALFGMFLFLFTFFSRLDLIMLLS